MAGLMDILLDALLDTCKLTPFLFVTYLFLEWLESKHDHRIELFLTKHHRLAPLVASLFGLVPECGFSAAASSLYATGVISVGTLVAVFLSTSDEMLPIMIASQAPIKIMLFILAIKVVVAIIAGYLLDYFTHYQKTEIHDDYHHEHEESSSLLISTIKRTLQISIWMFIITVLMECLLDTIGYDAIRTFMLHSNVSVLISSLIGIIPSCASSITLTTLYIDGIIGIGELSAGLLVNSGVGLAVLFQVNKNKMRNNFYILFYIFIVSIIAGMIINLLF